MMFKGSYVAIVTPFGSDGRVNFSEFQKLLEMHRDQGTAGIVVCGTTGESPTLSESEQLELFKFTVDFCKGNSLQVIAGTGSNNTQKSIDMTTKAQELGVDACLIVNPYYNKPNPAGIRAHYNELNKIGIPLILYNIPGRTGINIPPENIFKLCQEFKNIKGVKASNGDLDQITMTCRLLRNMGVAVMSGDDGITLPILAVGGVGVVSVVANIVPSIMNQIVNSFLSGDVAQAQKLALNIHEFCGMSLSLAPNPVPIKALMNQNGFKVGGPRLPLVELKDSELTSLTECYKNL